MGRFADFLDERLTYRTPKYTVVRDWRFGLAHRLVQLSSLAYVVVYTILYRCEHLRRVPVSGYTRVDISTPVKNGCFEADATCKLDLRNLAELPYCLQGKSQPSPDQKLCEIQDAYALSPQTPMPNALFVPSFVNRMLQRKACEPSARNGWSCEQTYVTEPKGGLWQHERFIADIERYRLLISHSYDVDDGDLDEGARVLMGRSESSFGKLDAAAATPPSALRSRWPHDKSGLAMPAGSTTAQAHVRHSRASLHEDATIPPYEGGNPDFRSLYHSPWGDELSLADLLKIADPSGADAVLSMLGENGLSRRERGGVIMVNIEYTNEHSFDFLGLAPPRYIISARLLPMQWLYQSHAVPLGNGTRQIEAYQGFLIYGRVHGHIRTFHWLSLLQVAATALVLLVVAKKLTEVAMMHGTTLAHKYHLIRHQPDKQVREVRNFSGSLQDEEGELLFRDADIASPELEHEDAARLSGRQELLAILRNIESKLDETDRTESHHFVREESADMAAAHLENFASELLGSGSRRVPPL
mmetsp:Transcript_62602/g.123714  ORF Transcript_62602/g.123714 Transcript_62602/m.123714 type:complete len:528 (+) Transcript_62602:35-1618(+)|eukprot:CAMPEP_0172726624 /NCGR_PEP_ID=MMETSP1074-20121228/91157_1 /TAXON_ID=2916 /ORGANISM="Ceratium fusus, Strain PA161109" /LENGTH=527 /DNA_ID=CAMNT_0013553699 /DNA_START=32 /DNA_END=1615 /DNA_ORIENTATION=+